MNLTTSQAVRVTILGIASASLLVFGVFPATSQEVPRAGGGSVETESATTPEVWTTADTRLANHYIQLLQKDPAYGNVLDLLWDLYAKKDQTALLLGYFEKASKSGPSVARLLYAHLLRKSGDVEAARVLYDEVLEADGEALSALKALAEIADQQKRTGKAISLYTRLVERIPVKDDDGVIIRLRKAELHREQGQTEEAVALWNELLVHSPGDVALRTEIVSLLLEAGETATAIRVLSELVSSGESRQKIEALVELNRLYEFVGDLEGAVRSARDALGLLHFKNHDYADLFSRLVRIHERFERLDDLKDSLVNEVDQTNPTEKALFDLAEFFRLTASPSDEARVVAKLVERLPGEIDYRIRLADIQMRNDDYELAAATLDEVLKNQPGIPLHLLLMRARIALHGEGRDAAMRLLTDYLASTALDSDGTRKIIDFARSNYLDALVERLLLEPSASPGGGRESIAAPIELARFLHERGRKEQAVETLQNYAAAAEGIITEKAARLYQISMVLRDLDRPVEALEAINEAIEIAPDQVGYLTARADLYVNAREIRKAITQLEDIWRRSESFDERAEIDQRLFSLLRGHYSSDDKSEGDLNILQGGNVQSLAEYRRLAVAATQASRTGDEPPPRELIDYYEAIKKAANDQATTAKRYRAAWWAFKLQDNQECYDQLTRANEESGRPILEVEQMLLSLAELNERSTLMVRHLTTLIGIDPANADDYRQKRAEMRFELGFEDEAVRELKELAAKPDASLNTLNTLAKVYQRQGSASKQIEVWQRAYREANVFEKRNIIKQLSTALIESGQAQEALKAQVELLEDETDPVQRRKQLDTQITLAKTHYLLDWMRSHYAELERQHPFDRFYPEALARVHQAAGHDREAFEMMKKAYYMSGQNEELLTELGELSDRLGDLNSAIYFRRQLLNRGEGDTLENWSALVGMLEKDLQFEEANRVRRRLETKFGTDTDFLSELTDHYIKDGHLRDAGRTLARLVELRSWDLESRFRLALLQIKRQENEAAFATLEKIIADTEDVEFPEGFGENILPLISVATLSEEAKSSPGNELDSFIFTVEEYPFAGGTLQDDIADALQMSRPEFSHYPKEPHLIRIRSIEEASALAEKLGRGAAWVDRWVVSERPIFEPLWAARHAGATKVFASLLEQAPENLSQPYQVLLAYSKLLCGQPDRLIEWIDAEDPNNAGNYPRSLYATMAALILLKDGASDPLRDPETIYAVLASLRPGRTVAAHLFSELREARMFEEAFRVGSLFADSVMSEEGGFLFALSQVAGMANHPSDRIKFLDRSLEYPDASGGGVSSHFFAAITERLSFLDHDSERRHFLAELAESILERKTGKTESLEHSLLLSLAAGDSENVIARIDELIDRQLQVIRPGSPEGDQVSYRQSQSWQRMSQILHYYADRISLDEKTGPAFVAAMGGKIPGLSNDPSVNSQYEQFEIDRGILLLEWLNAPERASRVREMMGLLREPESRLELGKALESRGFHREAIPVYLADTVRRGGDYAPLQGLFDAAAESLEPVPALALINQINSREFPAPPGLTVDYLNEQHAKFLLIDRDRDRLVQLSRQPGVREGAPPVNNRSQLPYLDALVEFYRQSGRDDELLRLLSEIRRRENANGDQLLLGAEILRRARRFEEALEWITPLTLDPSEPAAQRRALSLAIDLYEAMSWKGATALQSLALASLDQQSAAVSMELAGALQLSGASDEAVGILRLLRRKSSNPEHRSAAAMQLIRMQREDGATWSELENEFEALFQDFVYPTSSEAYSKFDQFIGWISSDGGDKGELGQVISDSPIPGETRWLGDILRGFLQGRLSVSACRVFADADRSFSDQILETLPSFGADGIEAARIIVEESGRSGVAFFPTQPERQISFFHRIGDRSRLIEVQVRLLQESQSDLFHQGGLDDWFPSIDVRQKLPGLFASIGETDLAGGLFRAYDKALKSYGWNHLQFLNDYGNFLIESGQYTEAELLLKRILRKSQRVDLRLVPKLYLSWGRLEQWEERMADAFLTGGQQAMIRDWVSVLAEGGEMVEYRSSW